MIKKIISCLSTAVIVSSFFNVDVYASENTLYQAYRSYNSEGAANGFRIIENGKDEISYCYDFHASPPEKLNGKYKTYYKRLENFLESNDVATEKYGKEKKKRIAAVLVAGYPINMYNSFEKYGLTETEAINVTQYLIWDINENMDKEIDPNNTFFTQREQKYYNELYHYSKIDEFKQGNIEFDGDFKFYNRKGYYSTDKIDTLGYKGTLEFENLPQGMEIIDFETNEIIEDQIEVGEEFYVVSKQEPIDDFNLDVKYDYNEVDFYFYKYNSGGNPNVLETYQNLVRPNLGDQNTINLQFDIDVESDEGEDIINPEEKPETPDKDEDTTKPQEKPEVPDKGEDTTKPQEKPQTPDKDEDITNPQISDEGEEVTDNQNIESSPNTGDTSIIGYIGLGSISLSYLLFRIRNRKHN